MASFTPQQPSLLLERLSAALFAHFILSQMTILAPIDGTEGARYLTSIFTSGLFLSFCSNPMIWKEKVLLI